MPGMLTLLVLFGLGAYLLESNSSIFALAERERGLDTFKQRHVDMDTLWKFLLAGETDKELGEPYKMYPVDVTYPSQKFHATLVEYPFGSTPRVDAQDVVPRGIMLYVHGYNDYFFQREMAEKADSAGFAFFAVDLHFCGRSYREGEVRADMRNLKEYYRELDYAIELSRQIVKENAERESRANRDTGANAEAEFFEIHNKAMNLPFVMVGHSMGGLLTSLYVNDRPLDKFDAVVLNSPFFEYNFNVLMRKVVFPLISEFALYFPDFSVGSTGDPNYAYSLLKSEKGEWEYNLDLKSMDRPTQYLGWVRAIFKGHRRVEKGLHINSPVLVLHSNCSEKDKEWNDNYTHCDGVLDVEHIKERSANIGENVKMVEVQDALHDVFLSKTPARDFAYESMFKFIDASVK